jgi:hypothetical protein
VGRRGVEVAAELLRTPHVVVFVHKFGFRVARINAQLAPNVKQKSNKR